MINNLTLGNKKGPELFFFGPDNRSMRLFSVFWCFPVAFDLLQLVHVDNVT